MNFFHTRIGIQPDDVSAWKRRARRIQWNNIFVVLSWKPAEKLDHQLMDTAKYSYYIRTAGVPAAALPNVAGPGKLVFDYGDSAAYLIEAATTADLEAVAAKLEVLGGRLALVLKKLPE